MDRHMQSVEVQQLENQEFFNVETEKCSTFIFQLFCLYEKDQKVYHFSSHRQFLGISKKPYHFSEKG